MASTGRSPCSAQVPHSRGAARRHRAGLVATGDARLIFLRISLEIRWGFLLEIGIDGDFDWIFSWILLDLLEWWDFGSQRRLILR